jgi:hypothetical protein
MATDLKYFPSVLRKCFWLDEHMFDKIPENLLPKEGSLRSVVKSQGLETIGQLYTILMPDKFEVDGKIFERTTKTEEVLSQGYGRSKLDDRNVGSTEVVVHIEHNQNYKDLIKEIDEFFTLLAGE